MSAQFSVSVPVEKASGCGAGQLSFWRMVLYHSAPTERVFAGGDMEAVEPPAFQAVMKDVMRGCQAVWGKVDWLA